MEYQEELNISLSNFDHLKQKIATLKKRKGKNLDDKFHELHHETFEKIDCLACANCCKTTSPIFLETDIERVAKSLKMKVGDFKTTYLRVDEENDWVLQSSPCPFLGLDNKCLVYNSRPKACREYPHTNRKRMHQILAITLENSLICPAVAKILQTISAD